jgi:hypothetical protein
MDSISKKLFDNSSLMDILTGSRKKVGRWIFVTASCVSLPLPMGYRATDFEDCMLASKSCSSRNYW